MAGLSPNPSDPLIGRSLGEFVVEEPIGEGGFGAVYRARQPLLDREAVIKVLRAEHLGSHNATQRFLREARLASRLDHPYAAHIYAFGAENDGILWIAMELVRGTPLDRLLRIGGPIALERLVPLLERLCEVIQTAHEQGIVHRDIKPANVMVLSRAGRLLPKLLDFGIAKAPIGESTAPKAVEPIAHRGEPTEDHRHDGALERTAVSDQAVLDTFEASPSSTAQTRSASESPDRVRLSAADSQALTHQGATMGSPLYMAPEQWDDSAGADFRADLYSVGILTYEALTGRAPLIRASMREMAIAHAADPIPPVGPDMPAEIDSFFRRALAKRPAERFDSAVAMADAFRAAAGLADQPTQIPRLTDQTRDHLLTGWPTPIADAAASFEAARNPHQARDAMRDLVATLIHYVTVLAIAARSRLGAGHTDSPQVTERMRQLFRNQLDEVGWCELAIELVKPWRTEPDVYPLPELIALLVDEPTPLLALATRVADSRGRSADEVRQELDQLIADFEALIKRASFLADYRLVVGGAEGAEQWTGVRRRLSIAVTVRGRSLEAGEVALVDDGGVPIVSLHPLLQVGPPTQGATDELFMVDGRGRRGVRLRAWPHAFERHDASAEAWFRREFADLLAGSIEDSVEERAPYRGLEPYTTGDASFYFGREQAVEDVVNRLSVQPWVVVVGPSGAGKSSFVQAGVIPALRGSWSVATLRPGHHPLRALASAQAELASDDDANRLLVIDQAEELFTLCEAQEEREEFARGVRDACTGSTTRVIVTLRDDFLVRASALEAWRGLMASSLLLLSTPGLDDLIRVLVEPARRAGYEFDSEQMPREMATEVVDRAGALPLLSFTAAQLWDVRDRHFRQLTEKSYRAIGGVGGALAGHAEGTLAAMSRDEQRLTRQAFRHLVTAEGTRAVLSRNELVEVLGSSAGARAVIARLVEARLLISSEGDSGEDRIEIVHEALLGAWPRLHAWIREDSEGTRLRDQLRTAAKQWDERGRPGGLLWRDDALTEYRLWRSKHPDPLTAVEEAFASQSIAEGTRHSRRRRSLVIGAFVILAIALVVFFRLSQMERAQSQLAASERQRAEDLMVTGLIEQGSRAMLAEDSLSALVLLERALASGRDTDAILYQLARGLRTVEAERGTLEGHRGAIWSIAISPDGTQLVSGGDDGKAMVWSLAEAALARTLEHPGPVRAVAFVGDAGAIATGGDDGLIRVFQPGSVDPLELAGHQGPIVELRASPDDMHFLSTSIDQTVRLWRVGQSEAVHVHQVGGPGIGGDFSADGTRVVVAKGALGAEIIALDGRVIQILSDPRTQLEGSPYNLFLRLSPRGDRVLATGWNTAARLWDADSGVVVAVLDGAMGNRNHGQFSRDGSIVVTTASGETAAVWSADTGRSLSVLRGHLGAVNFVQLLPDGERLLTGAMDGMVRLWDARTGLPLASHAGHDRPVFALAANGNQLASAGWDGRVRLFEPSRGDVHGLYNGDQPLIGIARLPGQRVAAVAESGAVSVVDASSAALLDASTLPFTPGHPVRQLDTDPTGRWMAVSRDDSVEIWDTANQTRLAQQTGSFSKLRFSPSGELLLVLGEDGATVWRWTDDHQQVVSSDDSELITATWLSESRIALASPNRIAVHDIDGTEVASLDVTGAIPLHLAVTADGKTLLAACADSLVRIIDVSSLRLRAALRGHTGSVTWTAPVPSTDLIASADSDGSVRIWNSIDGSPLAVLPGHQAPIQDGLFDEAGNSLVTVGMDGRLVVWNLSRETRPADAISRAVECSVPRALEGGRIVERPIPPHCR